MTIRILSHDDSAFYRRREREEREAASRSPDRAVAAIHADMANRYSALASRPIASDGRNGLGLRIA